MNKTKVRILRVTRQAREPEKRVERFEEMQIRARVLSVLEWRVLLALAYDGPQSMYNIGKNYDFRYPSVHRAMKNLEKIGWVEVVEKGLSEKNMPTKIYSLTGEGLLWLLSKIPKTVHPSLVDFSESDSLGLRRILEEKDISEVKNLGTQKDVYLHLLYDFLINVDRIAKNNTKLFPLIFGNWTFFKETEVALEIAFEFPEIAFSTLVEYYHNYSRMHQLGTLDLLFTYNLYYAFLELYSKGCANVDAELKNDMIQKAAVFGSNPQLKELFQKISKEIEDRLAKGLTFIKQIRTRARDISERMVGSKP